MAAQWEREQQLCHLHMLMLYVCESVMCQYGAQQYGMIRCGTIQSNHMYGEIPYGYGTVQKAGNQPVLHQNGHVRLKNFTCKYFFSICTCKKL